MTDPTTQEIRKRQKHRARIMALLLVAFAVLVFGITIAKLGLAT
ncbi:hypothetical protein [Sphingomicrobium nitratireducens]|nr:hypothetical protein [Sphingomicrobium nitratireducens]